MNRVERRGSPHDIVLVLHQASVVTHVHGSVLGILQLTEDHVIGETERVASDKLAATLVQVILQLRENALLILFSISNYEHLCVHDLALLIHLGEDRDSELFDESGAQTVVVKVAPLVDLVALHGVSVRI